MDKAKIGIFEGKSFLTVCAYVLAIEGQKCSDSGLVEEFGSQTWTLAMMQKVCNTIHSEDWREAFLR